MTAPLFANDRSNRGPWPGNLRSDNVTMSLEEVLFSAKA